jgi:hypothetical protein
MCSNIYFRIVYQTIKRRISPLKFIKNYQIDHHIHVRTSSNVGMSICATSLLCAQCMLLCAIFQLFDSKRSLIRYVLLILHDLNMEMSVDWIKVEVERCNRVQRENISKSIKEIHKHGKHKHVFRENRWNKSVGVKFYQSCQWKSQSHSPAHVLMKLYRMDNSLVC